MFIKTKLRHAFIAQAIALALSCSTNAIAAPQSIDIQAQSLSDALKILGKQTGLHIIYDADLIAGKQSPAVQGSYELSEVLRQLLDESKVTYNLSDNTVTLTSLDKMTLKNTGTLALTTVTSAADSTTEGTGSYITRSTNTATKLALSPRETPQSIVVITNQKILDENMQTFRDITDNVVGFNAPAWATDSFYINARGFEVDYYQLDGIPTDYDGSVVAENLIIYDRVEIIKGANGLVSGAGSPAASINMIRKHANATEFEGEVNLQVGSWNSYNAAVDLSSSLNADGSIRARVIVQHKETDTFRDLYHNEADTFYGVVDADFSDQTQASIGLSYINSESQGAAWSGLPVFFSDGTLTNFSPSDSFVPSWTSYDKQNISLFANIEHVFLNDVKVNANYMFNKKDRQTKYVAFMGHPDITTGLGLTSKWGIGYQDIENYSHALDVYASVPFEMQNKTHELIFGASYSKTNTERYNHDEASRDITAQSIYAWDGDLVDTTYADAELSSDSQTEQTGLYAVGRFNLLDNLKLIAGTRLSNYEYDCAFGWGCPSGYESKNVLTPYAGLVYDLNENHSAYVSYTSIFKAQDYKDINGTILDPKEGNSYEIGLKGEYFNNRLNASITYFKMQQDNVAESSGELITGTTDIAYIMVDGVHSEGIELSVIGEITDSWIVDFGLSSFSVRDAEGNKTNTLAPKNDVALSSKYSFGKLSISGGVTWQDEIYTDVLNYADDLVKVTQESFYLVNAMAKYQFNQDLSLQFNIDNLLDKEYYSNIIYGAYGGGYMFGEPRKATLIVNYNF